MAKKVILFATISTIISGKIHEFTPASNPDIKTTAIIPDELYEEVRGYRPKVVELMEDIIVEPSISDIDNDDDNEMGDQVLTPPNPLIPPTAQTLVQPQPIKPITEAEAVADLQEVDKIGKATAENLFGIGITSVDQLAKTDRETLIAVKGITENNIDAIFLDIEENFTSEEE